MEEGLKVILSADVSAFENAFVRATNATRQAVQQINQNLKGASVGFDALATTTNKLIPSFSRFSSIFKGAFLREFAGDTEKASTALAQAYDSIQRGTATFGQLLTSVQLTDKELKGLAGQISAIPVDYLETGLAKAEKTLQRFANGQRPMADLKRSIEQLQSSLPGMGNTAPVEKLILSLQSLQNTQKGMNVVGMDITPKIHAEDTLKEVERIKGLVASQQFHFQLTADSKPLQSSINQAAGVATIQALKIQQAVSGITFKPVSTAPLAEGLNQAESAIKKFSSGTVTVGELNRAIVGLIQAKEGLKDTSAVDKLITRLQALKIEASQLQATGIRIDPTVDVSGTLRDIEKVKGLIGGQQFNFRLTADAGGLQNAMVMSVESTRNAVAQINTSLAQAGGGYGQFAKRAQAAVIDYVRALGQLNTVPTSVKTTVQAPDMTPVLQAVQRVKSEITSATVTALPKLTLSADTAPFRQALLQTKAISQETWSSIQQTFTGVDRAIAAAAEKAKVSVQQLIQNFNALKGAGPNAVVMQVKPPDYGPVVAAAKIAKKNVDQAFLTPLPPIKMPAGAERTFGGLTKSSNEAMYAMMNLSRVVQDAPYGFLGIANNLNPLLESFQRLKAASGSTGTAMKALAGSLMGPGGIGLAVGAISTLLVLFGDELFKGQKKVDEMAISLAEFTRTAKESASAIEDVRSEVEQLNKMGALQVTLNFGTGKSADLLDLQGQSVTNLEKTIPALEAQVEKLNENRSRALMAALDKGSRGLKDAIDNDSLEYIIGELSEKDQKLGQAYLTAYKAWEDGSKKLTDAQQNQNYIEAQIRVKRKEINDENVKDAEEAAKKRKKQQEKDLKEYLQYAKDLQKVKDDLALIGKKIAIGDVDFSQVPVVHLPKDLQKEYQESLRQQFEKQIDIPLTLNFTAEQIKANALAPGVDKVFTDMIAKFRDAKVDFPVIDLNSYIRPGGAEELQDFLDSILRTRGSIDRVIKDWKRDFENAGLKFPAVDTSNLSPSKLSNVYRAIYTFTNNVNDILSRGITDSFSALGSTIADAISTGDITSGVQGILAVLGDAITAMGRALIEYGIIKEGLDKILAGGIAVPGMAAIVAGVAAVAAGQLVKTAFRPREFADGGIVYGPTFGMVGEYAGASSNPEVIAPLSKLKDLIEGSGGDKFPSYLPMHKITNSELKLWYARADRQGRKFN